MATIIHRYAMEHRLVADSGTALVTIAFKDWQILGLAGSASGRSLPPVPRVAHSFAPR